MSKQEANVALSEDGFVHVGKRTYKRTTYSIMVTAIGFAAWLFVSMDSVMPGIALPDISRSLHVSLSTLEYLTGAFAFVGFLTSVFGGPLLDRFGRKPVFQFALLGTGIFSGVTAIAGALWQFIIIRIFASISNFVEPIINTLVSEEAPKKTRGLLLGIVQAGYPAGAAIAGTIGAVLLPSVGWRGLFLVAFLPVLVVIFVSRYLREPARFQAVQSIEGQHRMGWGPLFRKGQRLQTLVAGFYGFCINGGIGLVIGVVTTFLVRVHGLDIGQAALLFGLSNWAALVGQVFVGWLADRIPSKYLLIGYPVVGALFMAILALPQVHFPLAAISLIGFGFFGNGTFGCYTRYVTESFPTEIRGTGTSFALGISFLTIAFMPIIGGILIESPQVRLLPIIAASIVFAAAILMLFGKLYPPQRELEELSPGILGEVATTNKN